MRINNDGVIRTAVLFPGQGSGYGGMMKKYKNDKIVTLLDDITKEKISKWLVDNDPYYENIAQRHIQPAIVAFSYMNYITDKGMKREESNHHYWYMGHSVGEYTALAASGFLPIDEILKLVVFIN